MAGEIERIEQERAMTGGSLVEAREPSLSERFGYWWSRMRHRFGPRVPSNLERHAERELRAAGLFDEDSDYGGMLGEATMKLIRAFSDEGHSGFSAGMAVILFEKLARFKPLGPLTGEDSEWNEIGEWYGADRTVYQNNRCSHVFKENGEAYDSQGRVFREPNGACFTSGDSRVPVTFPYTPTTEYVDVPDELEENKDGG